jgi:hypothetical protein
MMAAAAAVVGIAQSNEKHDFDNQAEESLSHSLLTKGSAALIEVVAPGHPLYGEPMSIESLTYAELGDRLGASPEAARSLARRLRLPKARQ